MAAALSYPRLKELLQHLELLLGPGTCIFRSDFELQRLVVLWVESHAALEHIRLEHYDARLIGVHDGQLEESGQSWGSEGGGAGNTQTSPDQRSTHVGLLLDDRSSGGAAS